MGCDFGGPAAGVTPGAGLFGALAAADLASPAPSFEGRLADGLGAATLGGREDADESGEGRCSELLFLLELAARSMESVLAGPLDWGLLEGTAGDDVRGAFTSLLMSRASAALRLSAEGVFGPLELAVGFGLAGAADLSPVISASKSPIWPEQVSAASRRKVEMASAGWADSPA